MKAIFEPVYNTAGVEQLNKELAKDGGRTVMVSGCIDTQKLHCNVLSCEGCNIL